MGFPHVHTNRREIAGGPTCFTGAGVVGQVAVLFTG